LPVLADAEIEEDVSVAVVVCDKEGECGTVYFVVTFYFGVDNEFGGEFDAGSAGGGRLDVDFIYRFVVVL